MAVHKFKTDGFPTRQVDDGEISTITQMPNALYAQKESNTIVLRIGYITLDINLDANTVEIDDVEQSGTKEETASALRQFFATFFKKASTGGGGGEGTPGLVGGGSTHTATEGQTTFALGTDPPDGTNKILVFRDVAFAAWSRSGNNAVLSTPATEGQIIKIMW